APQFGGGRGSAGLMRIAAATICGLLLSASVSAHEVACDPLSSDLCRHWPRYMAVPVDAPSEEMQGLVTVGLVIDPTGHIAACSIRSSSGIAALDAMTCAQLTAYAHYSPALDDAGLPVEASDEVTITWKYHPDDAAEAPWARAL